MFVGNKEMLDNINELNTMSASNLKGKKLNIYNAIKRTLDILGSSIGIILFSPVYIITAILIKSESKGSVIFKQMRIGKDSKPFYIYKFRSMRTDAPNIATNDLKDPDVYITKVGKFIRKTSIDELPQLFNILKGDMSIVGPRPVIEKEHDLLKKRRENNVDKILPGITGWAQINGRDNLEVDEKVRYDKEYLYKRNLRFDFYIMIMTVLKVLKRSDIK